MVSKCWETFLQLQIISFLNHLFIETFKTTSPHTCMDMVRKMHCFASVYIHDKLISQAARSWTTQQRHALCWFKQHGHAYKSTSTYYIQRVKRNWNPLHLLIFTWNWNPWKILIQTTLLHYRFYHITQILILSHNPAKSFPFLSTQNPQMDDLLAFHIFQ